ncbi:TetR/AcrR family transcriptional regulator [Polyangium jinanense]|uniref:TetR/AcrR family transcriptional regulator n=1 Tax=Polyangium jinanense TaxID=2829994 RepID=A0A9X4ARG8_9BACT|nr:TetR/AcrR family transcriptional regulator [Polyangium jinanense]MDC3954803.1 TetR/AcrR family transcriptional regulator [Polyangium jinanense]MDC3981426.1 TetR/AcrR family transcriptional regulator [Polyangium jinanense]
MARPKEFDRDDVVKRAMAVFWEKGYEATSTEDLLRAMGIGRQSMYDTFGDKRRLYLEALQRYQAESGAQLIERLQAGESPLRAIEEVLMAVAAETPAERARGCMYVSSIVELAQKDPEVASLARSGTILCETAFERIVREAKRKGEVDRCVDERKVARFLLATVQGLRVMAKGGATPEALRDIVAVALTSLKSR